LPEFNPSFRVIEYDSTTYEIMNVIQYYASLDAANSQGQVTWIKEYDVVSAYGVAPPLNLAAWVQIKDKIDNDPKYEQLYNRYRTVSSGIEASADADLC